MTRRRKKQVGLTGTRIYIRRGKYQYFSPNPIFNPKTKKETKWIPLCSLDDGELEARIALNKLIKAVSVDGHGDFSTHFKKWKNQQIAKRQSCAPAESARRDGWDRSTKDLLVVLSRIQSAFQDFDIAQVTPYDIAQYLDQWPGQRAAQLYRGYLVNFFSWAARYGLVNTNPAREVSITPPKKRDIYVTHEEFLMIRDALLKSENGTFLESGRMMQVYVDLLYLLYQRGTDVRLLKWQQITREGIYFKPTKTERSSGKEIIVPITDTIKKVLDRAKAIGPMSPEYVITNRQGEPYSAHGVGTFFERARKRVGLNHITLKDIRAKAATDAKKAGHTVDALKTALAHSDSKTTLRYIRDKEVPVSSVSLTFPGVDTTDEKK